MTRGLREAMGGALVLLGVVGAYVAVVSLRDHDYIAAILEAVIGLSLLRAGIELLKAAVGE